MAENNPGDAQNQPSPEPDPWATTPRSSLTPPPEDSPFARPTDNPWQNEVTQPVPPAQPEPTLVYPPEPTTNPYDTSGWGGQAEPQPFQPAPPPPPAPPAPPSYPSAESQWTPPPASPYASAPYTPAAPKVRDANPFAALFDFSFTKFATPGLVKIVYILQVVAAVLTWLIWIISGFGASRFAGGAGMGFVALFFGWIPVLLSIAFTRFVLEAIVALIRINDRVTEIAERTKGS